MHTQRNHQQTIGWSMPLAFGILLGVALLSIPAARAATLPPVYSHENVTFVSGGIGLEESMAMREVAPLFPLEVVFVEKDEVGGRAYSADNAILVLDARGNTVLSTVSDGPYMLISVPPGRYTVVAEDEGRYRKQLATVVPGGHQKVVFEW